MKSKAFYFSMILVFLFATVLVGCSSTDLNEEVGLDLQENIEEKNETKPRLKSEAFIDKDKIKVPPAG